MLSFVARISHLTDVRMSVTSTINGHNHTRRPIYNLVSATNGARRHILPTLHINHTLSIRLSTLITATTRNLHSELTERTLTVVINLSIGQEQERRLVSLPFRRPYKCLHVARLIIPINRSHRPSATILTITDTRAMIADTAELPSCSAVKAPPHSGLHTILSTNHRLTNVMQLIGISIVAVSHHTFVKVNKRVERASQLVSIAPLHIRLQPIIPFQRPIVVQRVSSCNVNILKARIILLQLFGNILEIS